MNINHLVPRTICRLWSDVVVAEILSSGTTGLILAKLGHNHRSGKQQKMPKNKTHNL